MTLNSIIYLFFRQQFLFISPQPRSWKFSCCLVSRSVTLPRFSPKPTCSCICSRRSSRWLRCENCHVRPFILHEAPPGTAAPRQSLGPRFSEVATTLVCNAARKLTRFDCGHKQHKPGLLGIFCDDPEFPCQATGRPDCVCLAGWAGISLEEALTWIIQQLVGKNNPARGLPSIWHWSSAAALHSPDRAWMRLLKHRQWRRHKERVEVDGRRRRRPCESSRPHSSSWF